MVMTTVARVENGRFVEEIVTFDTLDFFSQLGVANIDAEQPSGQPAPLCSNESRSPCRL